MCPQRTETKPSNTKANSQPAERKPIVAPARQSFFKNPHLPIEADTLNEAFSQVTSSIALKRVTPSPTSI